MGKIAVGKVVIHYVGDKGPQEVVIDPTDVAAVFFNQKWAKSVRGVSGSPMCNKGWKGLKDHAPQVVREGPKQTAPQDEHSAEFMCIKLNDCTWWCPE